MSPQNNPNIPASSSILHSPSQSERLSSKFLRKSKFLMKSNLNVDNPDSCGTTSTNDPLLNSESSVPPQQPLSSEMAAPGADTKLGIVLHTTGKVLRAAKNLHESKQATSSTPLSPANRSPPAPLMEITPPSPLSRRLQVTTPLESPTLLASSDDSFECTPELQPLTETQYTPCRLYIYPGLFPPNLKYTCI